MLRDVRIERSSLAGDAGRHFAGIDVLVRPPDWHGHQALTHDERAARQAKASENGSNMTRRMLASLDRILERADRIESAAHGPLPDNYIKYAGNICFAGRHLGSLLQDVASLGDAGDMVSLSLQKIDAAHAIQKVIGILAPAAERKTITIEYEPETPAALLADPRRLDQILTNLLSNAVKFTPENGRVCIDVRPGDPVRICVADSGPGIAEGDAERVFNRFERLGRSEEGTGLGLHIARAYAESMGGRLYVLQTDDPGATLCIELPAAD